MPILHALPILAELLSILDVLSKSKQQASIDHSLYPDSQILPPVTLHFLVHPPSLCWQSVSLSCVSLSHHSPSLYPFHHPSSSPQPLRDKQYCWCITNQDNLVKWQIRRLTWFVSDTVCSIWSQSNKAILPAPLCFFLSASPLIHPPCLLGFICCSKLPVQWDRNRLVSGAVTRSQAGATKASALIESWVREAVRFGKTLIDSLIGFCKGAAEICLAVVTNQSNN